MLSEKEVAFLEANEDWNISVDDLKGETQLVAFSPIFGTWDGTFELEVKDFEDLCQQLFSYWQAFDPDEETALWIGPDGHGQNGAPYRIRDILGEMDIYEQKLERLVRVCSDAASLPFHHWYRLD